VRKKDGFFCFFYPLFFVPLLNIFINARQGETANLFYKTITAQELLQKISEDKPIYLIDCRPIEEYREGHIPGALNVSMDSFGFMQDTLIKNQMEKIKKQAGKSIDFALIDVENQEEYMPRSKLMELLAHMPDNKDEEVIFYCRRPACTRSPLAARWALALGYTNIWRYEGSWEDWEKRNYPINKTPGLGNPKVHRLAENVLAITGLFHSAGAHVGVNAGMIFTPDGIVFIDAGMTINSAEYIWNVARRKRKRYQDLYLILTHHHSDHVFGMRVFKEKGAKVIAHRDVASWFDEYDGEKYKQFIFDKYGGSKEEGDRLFGDIVLSAPDEHVEKDRILNVAGDELHILVTPGHTADSIVVYHPDSETLFAGDTIYEGMSPNTRFGGPEEWKIWIAQLERLKRLPLKTVVPGHGSLCTKKELDRNIRYLKDSIGKNKLSNDINSAMFSYTKASRSMRTRSCLRIILR
jgi:glyoxylase-like metal-dependent hydrolase (beta-lactamase superfamily II)/rhodanese-related sulfurtransferase